MTSLDEQKPLAENLWPPDHGVFYLLSLDQSPSLKLRRLLSALRISERLFLPRKDFSISLCYGK